MNANKSQFTKKMPRPTSLKRGIPPLPDKGSKTVSLFSQPYLDTYNQCYKNIVVVNLKPQGPLGNLVKFTKFPPLSEFKQSAPCSPLKDCGYAIISIDGCSNGCANFGNDLMSVDEVPNLISYLVSNNYSVDTSITKMFNQSDIRFDTNTGNKLICFITYNG
ncbi:MAG: hypothetical protein WD512_05075 [Candidatus Paceibacterota bacterium]